MKAGIVQVLVNMDKTSMRRSVEVRVPFLYRPLVTIGLQSPDSKLINRFQKKAIIRKVAKQILPRFLPHALKMGIGPSEALVVNSEEVRELLLGSRSRDRALFRIEIVRKLLEAVKPRSDNLGIQIYSLVIIEQWFRSFIDSNRVNNHS